MEIRNIGADIQDGRRNALPCVAGVEELVGVATGVFADYAVDGFEGQNAVGIADQEAVGGQDASAGEFPRRFGAVDPDIRAVVPLDLLMVDVAIDVPMLAHIAGGGVADEILREPVFADVVVVEWIGVAHKIMGGKQF